MTCCQSKLKTFTCYCWALRLVWWTLSWTVGLCPKQLTVSAPGQGSDPRHCRVSRILSSKNWQPIRDFPKCHSDGKKRKELFTGTIYRKCFEHLKCTVCLLVAMVGHYSSCNLPDPTIKEPRWMCPTTYSEAGDQSTASRGDRAKSPSNSGN